MFLLLCLSAEHPAVREVPVLLALLLTHVPPVLAQAGRAHGGSNCTRVCTRGS
jgi:hypothetical protein